MYVTITSITLRGPMQFFRLASMALKITQQLSKTSVVKYKKSGFWTTHYTMTLWPTLEDLKQFAREGAHLEAMKAAKGIAYEVRTLTMPATELPNWKDAKRLLQADGKVLQWN